MESRRLPRLHPAKTEPPQIPSANRNGDSTGREPIRGFCCGGTLVSRCGENSLVSLEFQTSGTCLERNAIKLSIRKSEGLVRLLSDRPLYDTVRSSDRFFFPDCGVPSYQVVAFAGRILQLLAVFDFHRSTVMRDQAGLLQGTGGNGNA